MEKGAAKNGRKKRLWTLEEDRILMEYIRIHGHGKWNRIGKTTGLKRCGKSCRLRWTNYLKPNIKQDSFSPEEDDLIIRLHRLLGNRWALIAGRIPGRTDNQVKNHWNTYLSRKIGVDKGNSFPLHPRFSDDFSDPSASVANTPSPNSKHKGETKSTEGIPTPDNWDDSSFRFLDDYYSPFNFFQPFPSDSLDFLL